ncbi:MAG: glycosyltransferase [Pseudomonadota bacterium]
MSKPGHHKKINVLVATDHAGYEGSIAGVGRYLLNTLPAVDREQFNITLVILREAATLEQHLRGTGIQVRQLERSKFDPLTLLDFVRIIRQEKIDVLHVHQYATSNFGRVAGKITGVPVVLHIHGPDLHYPAYQKVADRLLANAVDCALAVSESARQECIRNRSIKPVRITTLPNGVPLEKFTPLSDEASRALKEHWSIPADSLVIGTVTRLHVEKGNRFFLEAAAQVLEQIPKACFVLAGDGPLLGQLGELANKLGIQDNVIFAGFQDDVVGLLSMFDVKVLPSLAEGHPQALLEAMAMGKAIVATTVGGMGEIISDGHDGCLVPPGDAQALAEKIIYLLQHEQEGARLGAAGYRKSRNYSLEAHVSKLESIYRQLVMEQSG